jgi:hypothetical protein
VSSVCVQLVQSVVVREFTAILIQRPYGVSVLMSIGKLCWQNVRVCEPCSCYVCRRGNFPKLIKLRFSIFAEVGYSKLNRINRINRINVSNMQGMTG